MQIQEAAMRSRAGDDGGRRIIPGLDGFRAVAVVMVVLFHSVDDLSPGNPLRPIAEVGSFGVPIFFCLSGFLITHLLLDEEERYGGVDLGLFYARRLLRILPPLLPLVATCTLLTWWGWLEASPASLASCLLFFRNYASGPSVTGHLWTLAVEEHFYLIWPLAFVACRSPWWRLRAVGAAVVVIPIWRRVAVWWAGSPEAVNWFRTDLRCDGILMGCLLALATRDARAGRWLGSRPMTHVAASGLALVALAVTFVPRIAASPGIRFWIPTIQFACVAGLLNQVTRSPRGLLTRTLSLGAVAWLGRLSYGLYLWQQLFVPPGWPGCEARVVHLPWNLGAMLIIATVSYHLVESPCSRLRSRLRRGSDRASRPVAATAREAMPTAPA